MLDTCLGDMSVFDACLHRVCSPLRVLVRPVLVTEPCIGLGGWRELCKRGRVPYVSRNSFDNDPNLVAFYDARRAENGEIKVRLGENGDVLKMSLSEIEDSEGLIAGTPCPPWAPNGPRSGSNDARSEVTERIFDWVVDLAWRGSLLWYAIENSDN